MSRPLLWPLILTFLLIASAAFAEDFVIVPGQRIGMITLGMSRAAVHTRLSTPSTVRRVQGMVLDTWLSPLPLPKSAAEQGIYLKHDYLTIFFQQGHAVQIEVSSPRFRTAAGLSTNSPVRAFEKRYPRHYTPRFTDSPFVFYYFTAGDETSPAPKHFVDYGEALVPHETRRRVTLGIAWKYGAWGALAPEPYEGHQEAIVVYFSGSKVRLNPNDGLSYSGTWNSSR